MIDERLGKKNNLSKFLAPKDYKLRFDEKGLFALERLQIMHKVLGKKNSEVSELVN